MLCHGEADAMVGFPLAQQTLAFLTENGVDATLRAYPGLGHGASEEELEDVAAWLARRLPP